MYNEYVAKVMSDFIDFLFFFNKIIVYENLFFISDGHTK